MYFEKISYVCIKPRIKKHNAYIEYEIERTVRLLYRSPIDPKKNWDIEYVKNNRESKLPRNLISTPS